MQERRRTPFEVVSRVASRAARDEQGGAEPAAANRLLGALPHGRRKRLAGLSSPVELTLGTVLFEPGQIIDSVDFPRDGVELLVTPLADGRTVEVAAVGNDGILGIPLVPGGSLAVRAVCSVPGFVDRFDAMLFRQQVETDTHLGELVDDFEQSLINRLSIAVACNRLHSTTERLARWLLTSSDQTGGMSFDTTFAFLGQLLGCGATSIGRSVQALQDAGVIRHDRGRITIVDPANLRMAACECYGLIKREADGVVQKALVRTLVLTD